MAESIKFSEAASSNIEKIMRYLKMDRPTIVRLALAKGLIYCSEKGMHDFAKINLDSKGVEVPLSAINGKDEVIFNAIIRFVTNKYLDEANLKKAYKYLIELGLDTMWQEMEKHNDISYIMTLFPGGSNYYMQGRLIEDNEQNNNF